MLGVPVPINRFICSCTIIICVIDQLEIRELYRILLKIKIQKIVTVMYSIHQSYRMRSNVLLFWTTATHICIVMMSTHMQISVYFIDYTSTIVKQCYDLAYDVVTHV